MIVPAVGAQDTRITSDLPLPNQRKKKKGNEKDFGLQSLPSKQQWILLIMQLEISERWISMP